MGYRIDVDHAAMRACADQLRSHAETCQKCLVGTSANGNTLRQVWKGKDGAIFASRLESLDDHSSTPQQIVRRMKDYADKLEEAANKYTKAQADSIKKAGGI